MKNGDPGGDPRSVSVMRRRATLPHPLGCSTIAVPGLSFRVRNGVRASHLGHGRRKSSILLPTARVGDGPGWRSGNRRMDAMFFVVPRFVTMRSLSPGMPHAAVGA